LVVSRPRAFSLIELVIVVVVVAVGAALVAPRLGARSAEASLASSAMQLKTLIEQQRERASALGLTQSMRFASDGVVLVERGRGDAVVRAIPLRGATFHAVTFGSSKAAGLCFRADGSMCQAGSLILAIDKVSAVRVDVEAVTGVVRFGSAEDDVNDRSDAVHTTPLFVSVADVRVVPSDAEPERLLSLVDLEELVLSELASESIPAHSHK
jgi:prepilin-type N-terminal cleavage/methylation domain-containing protein